MLVAQSLAEPESDSDIAKFEQLIKAGHYEEARPGLEAYTKSHPGSWRALYQLGYIYFRLRQISASILALQKSVSRNGDFADAHKILAFDFNIVGRQDLALQELNTAIALDPKSFESFYEVGRILFERGSYPQAIEAFEKSRALSPEFVKVYHNLGLAYSAVQEHAKAVQNFEGGLALNAQQNKPSAWPLIDYGTYRNHQGDYKEAKALLLQSIQIDGRWDQAYTELAKSHRALGDIAAAVTSLERAIALNPDEPSYRYSLSKLYQKLSRSLDAQRELNEFIRLRQSGPAKN